jgi:hypothetical protein
MAEESKASTRRSTSNQRRRSSSGSSRSNGSGSSTASRKRASRRAKSGTKAATSSRTKRATPAAPSPPATTAAKEAAVSGTKAAGQAISAAASKAKTPLMMGGAVIAGLAGGAALRDRLGNSRSAGVRQRLNGLRMPRPDKRLDLGKVKDIDFDKVASAAQRVGSYGRQVDEVASAVKRASEAAKKGK